MSLVPDFPPAGSTANESLAQTLVIGNVSGPNDIAMSGGQKIDFATDISLKNGVGGDVIVDAIPLNSGPPLTEALFYDVATNKVLYQLLAPNSETLAQTLVLGNTTGANNISVASPQRIDFDGSIRISNNNTGAGSDVVISSIPANPGPTINETLVYDTGSGNVYYQTPFTESLAGVLAVGNTTGANDIAVASPQKIDFAGNISLKNNSGGGGTDVIINAIPANPGPSLTSVVYYDPATSKLYTQTLTPSSEDLTQTLALGNQTGPNDIVFTSPQKASFLGDINLQCGAGSNVLINALPINNSVPFFEVQYDPTTFRLYYAPPTSQLVPQVYEISLAGNQPFVLTAGASGNINMILATALQNLINTGAPQFPNLEVLMDLTPFTFYFINYPAYSTNDIVKFNWTDGVKTLNMSAPPYNYEIVSDSPLNPYVDNGKKGNFGVIRMPINALKALGFNGNTTTLTVTNTSPSCSMFCGLFSTKIYATLYPTGVLL